MSGTCEVLVNGRAVQARIGETLVEAALNGSVVIPHDCCSGQCETCRVTVLSGQVDDRDTRRRDTVLACQARIVGSVAVTFDEVPPVRKVTGRVRGVRDLSSDTLEVVVATDSDLPFRPGQYVSLKFAGYPARDYSPTLSLETHSQRELTFHIARYPGGAVSSHIGRAINVGHKVHVQGPFGSAFFRPGAGRLILVAGGTGFAPLWPIAVTARRDNPDRTIVLIWGARRYSAIYMRDVIERLSSSGIETIVTATNESDASIRSGRPTDHLPVLRPDDTIHVAGPHSLVENVSSLANLSGCRCYADSFHQSAQRSTIFDRFVRFLIAD